MTNERAFHPANQELVVTEFYHFDFDSLKPDDIYTVRNVDPIHRVAVLVPAQTATKAGKK